MNGAAKTREEAYHNALADILRRHRSDGSGYCHCCSYRHPCVDHAIAAAALGIPDPRKDAA